MIIMKRVGVISCNLVKRYDLGCYFKMICFRMFLRIKGYIYRDI